MITITINPETSAQMSILAKALIALLADQDTPAEPAATPSAPLAVDSATPTATAPAEAAPVSKPITLEEVRAKLADLSRGGKTAEVKALIAKFGAGKLTDIQADKYSEMLTAAEAL